MIRSATFFGNLLLVRYFKSYSNDITLKYKNKYTLLKNKLKK